MKMPFLFSSLNNCVCKCHTTTLKSRRCRGSTLFTLNYVLTHFFLCCLTFLEQSAHCSPLRCNGSKPPLGVSEVQLLAPLRNRDKWRKPKPSKVQSQLATRCACRDPCPSLSSVISNVFTTTNKV